MPDLITISKQRTTQATELFLRVLGHVPGDKLTWSPTPTAKNALQIAAHAAGYSAGFVRILREGAFPPVEEFLAPIHAAIESITTVAEAEAMLRAGAAETLAALEAVDPQLIEAVIETPIGPTAFLFFMNLPAEHLIGHTYQIDYLQTCWGDQEVHL
jgi:hypothetical protein